MTNDILGCIITGGVCLLLLAIALVLLRGRGAMLIAGYNTMSPAKREKYDAKALGRFVGWLLIAMIPCLLLTLVGLYFELGWLVGGSVAAAVALPMGAVVYANTGGRFRREE